MGINLKLKASVLEMNSNVNVAPLYTVNVTQTSGEVLSLDLEEYLIGVVAGEMPLSFEDEALKAQIVASRTYVLSRTLNVDSTTSSQVYLSKEQLKQQWQSNYEQNYARLKKLVESTHQQVIKYNNEYISALFFASSNGQTENSEDYFVSSGLPYLRSVESKWDLTICPTIHRTKHYTFDELKALFGFDVSEIHIDSLKNSHRVNSVTINNHSYTGRQVRELLKLASSDFTVEKDSTGFIFNTVGSGHGVGMSQYGANGMALEGYDYESILKYYYQGVEIVEL